jgi:predicted nucleic-acid-binding Zn-ribbon protein
MQDFNFTCPKCGNNQCDVGEFRAASGFLSKIFDVQSKRFSTVTCTRCQYTEIYRAASSKLGNVFDFFTN